MYRRKYSLFFFLLMFFGFLKSGAQNLIPDNDFRLNIKGEHDFYYHLPLNYGGSYKYPISSPKLINQFGLTISHKNIKVFSEWELRSIIAPTGQQSEMIRLIPKENYIRYTTSKLNWTFGLQKYAWGMADQINPTNNLNPLDYTITGFEPEQIPVLSSSIEYFPNNNWKIQAVYLPFKPLDDIFWSYSEVIPDELFSKYLISDFDFITQTPIPSFLPQEKSVSQSEPEYSLNSGIYAGRLNYFSSNIDLSLSYSYDFDSYYTPQIYTEKYFPGITDELKDKINGTLPEQDAYQLIYYLSGIYSYRIDQIDLLQKRIHRYGANAKTIVGKFGLWLEACYSITGREGRDDYKNRGNDLFFVVGTDFNFGPNDGFYGNIQYTGKWVPEFNHSFYSDYPNGHPLSEFYADEEYMHTYYYRSLVQSLGFQNETWLHGVSFRLDFSFFDGKLKPTFTGYFLFPAGYDAAEKSRNGSVLLMPSIDYSPGNALHFKLGAYLSYSAYKKSENKNTAFDDHANILGLLNPYNNLFFNVSYSWNHKNN